MNLEKGQLNNVFMATHSIQTSDGLKKLEIDEKNKKFAVHQISKRSRKEYSFSDLLAVEVIENGKSINRVTKKNHIEYKVRDVNFNLENENEVIYLNLRIEVDSSDTPVIILNFLPTEIDGQFQKLKKYKKTNKVYFNAEKEISQWYKLISYIIHSADTSNRIIEETSIGQVLTDNSISHMKKKFFRLINHYKAPLIITITLFLMVGIISGLNVYSAAKEREIAAYNSEELLIHKIKDNNSYFSIKELVEEYMINNNIKDYLGLEKNLVVMILN